MRVLLTGHNGYIGSVMAPFLQAAGHDVVGLDSFLFEDCTLGEDGPPIDALRMDLRDVTADHLLGFDAVIHLAALSNDPLGNLNPDSTYDINHRASVTLAQAAKDAGVARFLFASSCSLYGVAGDEMLAEDAAFNPLTAYGHSKVLVERDVAPMADDRFTPVFLRNATAYGFSPRLRADVVVNSLVLSAVTTGEVFLQSDGTPWRPLVHVEDISRAFLAALEAPRESVHNRAFNVGRSEENYRVRDVAEIVRRTVPGSTIRYADGAGPDPRCYRVSCDAIERALPAFRAEWNVERGARQVYDALLQNGVKPGYATERFVRMAQISKLTREGHLDGSLRRIAVATQ